MVSQLFALGRLHAVDEPSSSCCWPNDGGIWAWSVVDENNTHVSIVLVKLLRRQQPGGEAHEVLDGLHFVQGLPARGGVHPVQLLYVGGKGGEDFLQHLYGLGKSEIIICKFVS